MLMQDSYDATECEGWLVPVVTQAHEGDSLDVFYYLGYELNPCGNLQNEDVTVYAVTPEGKRQYLDMISHGEDRFTHRIKIGNKGLYHIIAEKRGYYSEDAEGRRFMGDFEDNPDAVSATRYMHFAHTALQSGESLVSSARAAALMPPLCIVPDKWSSFIRVGEVFSFTLYFMDRPLPLYDISIIHNAVDGETVSETFITNGDGRLNYPINQAGKYVVVVRYTSPEYKEGLYYATKYTYTFWFKARA